MGAVSTILNHRCTKYHRVYVRHEFEWKREECYMLRKPDPPVLVAVTKVTPGRLKTSSVQILDYNLNRSVHLLVLPTLYHQYTRHLPALTWKIAKGSRS